MLGRAAIGLVAMGLLVSPLSCTRLPESPTAQVEPLSESLPQEGSIPSEWGKLISVSSLTHYGAWVQLWFQDDDGNVRWVPYNVDEKRLGTHSRLIPLR